MDSAVDGRKGVNEVNGVEVRVNGGFKEMGGREAVREERFGDSGGDDVVVGV